MKLDQLIHPCKKLPRFLAQTPITQQPPQHDLGIQQ